MKCRFLPREFGKLMKMQSDVINALEGADVVQSATY